MLKRLLKVKEINQSIEEGSDQQALSTKQQLVDSMKPLSLKDVTNSKIENIPRHILEEREVQVKIISKDHNGRNCPVGGCQASVQLETGNGKVTAAHVWDNNDGSYMVAKQVGEENLSVAINGQQIKGSPYHFTVYKNYLVLCTATKILGVDDNINFG